MELSRTDRVHPKDLGPYPCDGHCYDERRGSGLTAMAASNSGSSGAMVLWNGAPVARSVLPWGRQRRPSSSATPSSGLSPQPPPVRSHGWCAIAAGSGLCVLMAFF